LSAGNSRTRQRRGDNNFLSREFSIRASLGATRSRLARQFFAEAIPLAVGDPSPLTSAVSAAIREIDPDQPLYDVRPMTDVLDRTLHGQWLNAVLIGCFAGMSLLLAAVGLYGVVSYLTAQRRREFGIRKAVGAKATDVLRLVLRQGLGRAACGLALGPMLSALLTCAVEALLYGVSALDAPTYASVSAPLMVVVLAASFIPAWRASCLDPTAALRQE
jgi:ABC-type antimicrobial peptide transport system permease subunit